MQWTIDGRADADVCVEVGAVSFESVIVDQGFVVGRVSAPCEDFQTEGELYTDDFLARSTLVGARGVPVVPRVIEDVFVIADDQVTTLAMDFPSSATPMPPEADAGGADAGARALDAAPAPSESAGLDAGLPDASAVP